MARRGNREHWDEMDRNLGPRVPIELDKGQSRAYVFSDDMHVLLQPLPEVAVKPDPPDPLPPPPPAIEEYVDTELRPAPRRRRF